MAEIRFATPEDALVLKSWRRLHPEVDEFVFTWTRWKKWEEEPPIVAVVDNRVVGYHGVSYTKSGYVNSASQFVLESHRGRRLAGDMINLLLERSSSRGMRRLRFRTPTSGDGLKCWTGFGVKPFGEGNGDYWFDLRVEGVTSLAEFIALAPSLHLPPTECRRRLTYYRKSGVTALVPEYKDLLK